MKTGFLLFVADHLLVGQLCTNPKSDRSPLSCLKVIQFSTSEIGYAQLYNSCSLPIQLMTTGPLPDPQNANPDGSTCPGWWKQSFRLRVMVFGMVSSEGHIIPPQNFEVGLKVNIKMYLEVLKSVVIPWCNQVAGGRPWEWQQYSAPAHRSKETEAWLQKDCYGLCTLLSLAPSSPELNSLDDFVRSYVENITNMTFRNTKASPIAAIRRVFTEPPPVLVEKACSSSGSVSRLKVAFWIDVSSTA